MASAVASAIYNEGLAAEPPDGSRGRALVRGLGGQSPLKLKAFWISCAEFPLKYFVFNIFYHVSHVASKRNVAVLATAYDWKTGAWPDCLPPDYKIKSYSGSRTANSFREISYRLKAAWDVVLRIDSLGRRLHAAGLA